MQKPPGPLLRLNLRPEALAQIAMPIMLCQNRLSGRCERSGCDLRTFREKQDLSGAGRGVHGRARLPERGEVPRAARGAESRWSVPRIMEELKEEAKVARALEPLFARLGSRRRPHQPGVRAAVRGHGPQPHCPRGFQLQRPRHGQHGGARTLRDRGAERAVAEAAARRRDTVLLRDDRAGRGLLGRHQHPGAHREGRG